MTFRIYQTEEKAANYYGDYLNDGGGYTEKIKLNECFDLTAYGLTESDIGNNDFTYEIYQDTTLIQKDKVVRDGNLWYWGSAAAMKAYQNGKWENASENGKTAGQITTAFENAGYAVESRSALGAPALVAIKADTPIC